MSQGKINTREESGRGPNTESFLSHGWSQESWVVLPPPGHDVWPYAQSIASNRILTWAQWLRVFPGVSFHRWNWLNDWPHGWVQSPCQLIPHDPTPPTQNHIVDLSDLGSAHPFELEQTVVNGQSLNKDNPFKYDIDYLSRAEASPLFRQGQFFNAYLENMIYYYLEIWSTRKNI